MIQRRTQIKGIQDYFQDFITEKEAINLSPSSIRYYKTNWDYFCKVMSIDNIQPETLDTSVINDFVLNEKNKGTSITSINTYLRAIRTFFNWLEKKIHTNVNILMLKEQQKSISIFNDNELDILLKRPKENEDFETWRTYYYICFVLATGVRPATATAIKLQDIDFKRKIITFTHTKTRIFLQSGLSPTLEKLLREYIDKFTIEDWLFPNVYGNQLTTNACHLAFTRYCTRRGIENHNMYHLRHTYASKAIQNGMNAFVLQKQLGHSSISTTQKYIDYFSLDTSEAITQCPLDSLVKKRKF